MKVDVTVPELAESITEAVIGEWLKKPGDVVEEGEQIVDIETDKVILEITAPESGELAIISKNKNDLVQSNEVIAVIDTSKKSSKSAAIETESSSIKKDSNVTKLPPVSPQGSSLKTSPAVRKLAAENNIDLNNIHGSGKDGRITKQDVQASISKSSASPDQIAADTLIQTPSDINAATEIVAIPDFAMSDSESESTAREDKYVPMTTLRKNIAKRLVSAQQESAMLTTFNEVNMQQVIDLRRRYKESFEESHGIKLGFMSFFVKAAVEALKEYPVINSYIEDDNIVYHDYFDIGIAVSTQRGLIVPILRNAERMTFANIEIQTNDFATRARDNKVTIDELTGGTFTITNGGVFGSLLSTPIINPPQSAILGMHAIQARPIAKNGEVVIAPMMYLALSYDHRIIDGKEAVQFLVHIKNIIEDPNRLLLQV